MPRGTLFSLHENGGVAKSAEYLLPSSDAARAMRVWIFSKPYLLLFAALSPIQAYSVLTHEAIVDAVWLTAMQPALKSKFPAATAADFLKAHSYAYGGCLIQDLGYYPFGSHLFTDLTHYIRSADFVQALLDEATDINELAFALGAVSHYHADVQGHSIAVNRSVALLFPELRRKFGDVVTYADNPGAHLRTEFGFDVLEVAKGHYAPAAYHDFIGFNVAKDLLERAFHRTYGLSLKDVFSNLDLTLGTFRYSVRSLIPNATKLAWDLKKKEILNRQPGLSRNTFLYNLKRSSYEKEWGNVYEKIGWRTRLLSTLLRIVPRVGPFRGFGFRTPTAETEHLFEDSFDSTVARDQETIRGALASGNLRITNRDLDTGQPISPGEYELTDRTYDNLLIKLAHKQFDSVSPELRANILAFYGQSQTPEPHGVDSQIAALRLFQPPTR